MSLFSKAKVSPEGKLNKADISKWLRNLLVFLAPVFIIYLMQVQGLLAQEGHTFSVSDFIPSVFTRGAMTLYVVNGLIDILRKFLDGSK
jgi:hypothetical protein